MTISPQLRQTIVYLFVLSLPLWLLILAYRLFWFERFFGPESQPDPSPSDLAEPAAPSLLVMERPLMGTTVRITLAGSDAPARRQTLRACFDLFETLEDELSEWKEDSPISRLNASAGRSAVRMPPDAMEVLKGAVRVSEASGGAFDVTWAALRGLWIFDGSEILPDPAEVAERLSRVGWRHLRLDPEAGTAYLPQTGMAVGLGGIAKGYALDRAAAELLRRGEPNYLLDMGGQVTARGEKSPGIPWRVGIRDPRGGDQDYFASLTPDGDSISTSGDYEHYFIKAGVRYHHILDLRTGYPARGARSATVVSRQGMLGDAVSTAALVLGPAAGLALAENLGVTLLLVDDAGQVHVSPSLASRLEWKGTPAQAPDVP